MKPTNENLLGKVINSPHIAATLARHKTQASNSRLIMDLVRFGPAEKADPSKKLEEWRAIAQLKVRLQHDPNSNQNLGNLLKPSVRSEVFLEKLQKASPRRAAELIQQESKNFKEDLAINLYWVGIAILNWNAQGKATWMRWAKSYYLTIEE